MKHIVYLLLLSFAALNVLSCADTAPEHGIPGPVGPKGDIGMPGAAGPAGSDATIGTIQFCAPQGATTYGHFPEYGLCIGNKLYGVYWDGHSAFLAEIVPGTYISTSTGLQCTFTVAHNCEVL